MLRLPAFVGRLLPSLMSKRTNLRRLSRYLAFREESRHGGYRRYLQGEPATDYVNPDTGLHASFAARGPYVGEYPGGWMPRGDQLSYLQGQGNL